MAHIWEDRVVETSTTTGTGAFTLAGAVAGFRAFGSVMTSPSDTCYYFIEAISAAGTPTGEWETGLGTYSGANTLTRTTVLESSNAGAAVNFSAGTKRVGLASLASFAAPASSIVNTPAGSIVATTTQAAVNELDEEKVAKAGDTMTGVFRVETASPTIYLNETDQAADEIKWRYNVAAKSFGFQTVNDAESAAQNGYQIVRGAGVAIDRHVWSTGGSERSRIDNSGNFQMGAAANTVIDSDRLHRLRQYTVATLPTVGTAGRLAAVTDASAPTYNATVAGGGAVNVPVYDNGTNWVAH